MSVAIDKEYAHNNQEYRTCEVRFPIMPAEMCFLTYKKY